jgi:membrane protease YdiL (CAAX protease family)
MSKNKEENLSQEEKELWDRLFQQEKGKTTIHIYPSSVSQQSKLLSLEREVARLRQKEEEEQGKYGKNLPVAGAGKKVVEEERMRNLGEYKYGATTLFFILLVSVLGVTLFIRYGQGSTYDPSLNPFLFDAFLAIMFIFVGFEVHKLVAGNPRRISVNGIDLLYGAFAFIIVAVIQFYAQAFIKFSIAQWDLLFLYLLLAVGEEMMFRFGLQASLTVLFEEMTSTWIASLIAITISAFTFMFVHFFVYPLWSERIAVLGAGIIFGIFFQLSKNIDTTIIAHFSVNFIGGLFSTKILVAPLALTNYVAEILSILILCIFLTIIRRIKNGKYK